MTPLIAILTSRDIVKLERCIKSILVQAETKDVVVIINTLDEKFKNLATFLSASYGIKSVITESNGACGKGKNSVIEYFLTTDYTHLVPVEGDDYLLPSAIQVLDKTYNEHNMDLLSLIDFTTIVGDKETTVDEYVATKEYTELVKALVEPSKFRPFAVHIQKIRNICVEHGNFQCRFILINRKAASLLKFNENILAAEDSKEHVRMKVLNYKGEISYKLLSSKSVYVYDFAMEGTFFSKLFKSNPKYESEQFWEGITEEDVAILKNSVLEKISD